MFSTSLKTLLNLLPSEETEAKEASDLHYAAYLGDAAMLEKHIELFKSNGDISLSDKNGQTPLHLAVKKGHLAITDALLQNGADPNLKAEGEYGYTPLHLAKTADIAKLLMENGANVDSMSDNGDRPIHSAARRMNYEVIETLISNGADVNATNKGEMTPLSLTCEHGLIDRSDVLDIAKLLVKAGSNVNARDDKGKTVLHYLNISKNSHDLIVLLLTHGARLDVYDNSGKYPIHNCVNAPETNSSDCLKLYLPSKEAANLSDSRGRTALHLLAERMDENLIEVVIKAGGEVNMEDNQGKTPLHYVSENANKAKSVVGTLIRNGAAVDSEDKWGRTPLMVAVDNKCKALTETFIALGANVSHTDKCGHTALHFACFRGAAELVQMLIDKSANVNVSNIFNTTPMHAAAYSGSLECAQALIDAGAERDVLDAESMSPFDISHMHETHELYKLLSVEECSNPHLSKKLTNVSNEYLHFQSAVKMVQNNEVQRTKQNLETFLNDLLESPTLGRGADDKEALEIQEIIEDFIQTLAKRIENANSKMRCTVLHAGSTSEGTKTRRPDEFDFMFCLEDLSELIEPEFPEQETFTSLMFGEKHGPSSFNEEEDEEELEESQISVSDYTYIKVKDTEDASPFKPLLVNYGMVTSTNIQCCAMYNGFSNIVEAIFFSKDFHMDPRLLPWEVTIEPAIEFRWHGSRYKDMQISIDLVPALRLPQWPERMSRNSKLLTKEMLKLPCLVVPKMTAGENEDLWRCSLALVETSIFRAMRPVIRNSYVACKALLSSKLLPIINFDDYEFEMQEYRKRNPHLDADDAIAFHEHVESIVPSYVLKMTFLSILEEKIKQYGLEYAYALDNLDTSEATYTTASELRDDAVKSLKSPEQSRHRDRYMKAEEIGITEGEFQNKNGCTDKKPNDERYGPSLYMYVAKRTTVFNADLIREVFKECEQRLAAKWVSSVFNEHHNILGQGLLSGNVDKALLFIQIVNKLLA